MFEEHTRRYLLKPAKMKWEMLQRKVIQAERKTSRGGRSRSHREV